MTDPSSPTVVECKLLSNNAQYYSVDQSQLNAELHEAVGDAARAVAGLRANIIDEITAVRTASEAAMTRCDEALKLFEAEVRHPRPIVVTRDELVTHAALGLESTFVSSFTSANPRVQTAIEQHAARYRQTLSPTAGGDVAGSSVAGSPMAASLALSRRDTSSPVAPVVGTAVAPIFAELRSDRTRLARRDELLQELAGWRNETLPLGDHGVVGAATSCVDLELADPLRVLRAELTKGMQVIAGTEAILAQELDHRKAAIRSEDMSTAETRSAAALNVFETLLAKVRARVEAASDAVADVNDFMHEVSTASGQFSSAHLQSTGDVADLRRSVDTDFDKLSQWLDDLTRKSNHDAAEHERAANTAKCSIAQCTEDEREIWQQITSLLGKLEVTQQRREGLISQFTADVEAERIRAATFAARREAAQEHLAVLEAMRLTLKGAEELLHALKENSDKSLNAIERRQWPRKQNDVVVKECVRYHEAYLRFVLFAGELVHRAEHRRTNTKRLLRSAEFQAKTATDMLDPELPFYRELIRRHTAAVESLEERLGQYRSTQQREAVLWRPMEACLDENDIEFDPPELALQELQRDLAKNHCAAVDDLTLEEQKLLDQEKRQVRNIANLCDATKAAIEEKRVTKAAAREHDVSSPNRATTTTNGGQRTSRPSTAGHSTTAVAADADRQVSPASSSSAAASKPSGDQTTARNLNMSS